MIKKYIEFKNIGKTYSDSFTAVSDFNLSINKGEFVTLLGPSGCGKTTILKMIGGFETISEGTISINGYIINDLPPNKRVTSTVFQDYALFPNLTVYKNIMFGLKSFRVDLPKEEIKQDVKRLERYKRIWHKTATKKINDIEKDLVISRENLSKALNKYSLHPEWIAIKTMREENYQKKVLRLETLKRAMKKNGDVLLDKKITNTSTRFDREFVALHK
jgi:spermidine/putrescine transport system ATP-binding protein